MSKTGHEMPNNDNGLPGGKRPANIFQLRIGEELPEPLPPERPTPPGLQLTPKEEQRVERLMESGLDKGTAVLHSLSSTKARRIIGHDYASNQVEKLAADAQERAEHLNRDPDGAELLQLLRDTDPDDLVSRVA